MNRTYFDTRTSSAVTGTVLFKMWGYPQDEETLKTLGVYPIFYDYPKYDSRFYTISPKGDPTPDLENNRYVQSFDIVELSLDSIKESLKRQANEKRHSILDDGTIIINNIVEVPTSESEMNTLSTIVSDMEKFEIQTVDYKFKSGFSSYNLDQMKLVLQTLMVYIQSCFSHEKELYDLIDSAESISDFEAIDINSNWPSTEISV